MLGLTVRQLTKIHARDIVNEIKEIKAKIKTRKSDINKVDKLLAAKFGE